MPSGRKPAVYWETSVFITWFLGGTQHPQVFEAMEEFAKAISRGHTQLVTSVLTRAELLEIKLPPGAIGKYDELLKRKNCIEQPIIRSVAELCSSIRSHFPALKQAKRMADALHVATAVIYGVDQMHTTDEAVLNCDGDPILRGVRILRPSTEQQNLLTGVQALPHH